MASKKVIPLDTSLNPVNPASDENVGLLRRIVKLLETSAVQDSFQRQRVVVDAFTGSMGTGSNAIGIVSIAGTLGSTTPIFMIDQRYEMMDRARMSYAV